MGQFDGLPKTTNLKLNKPSYDNVADIEALNENADILDTEISKIKGKYVSSVNGKTGDVTIEKYTHPNSGVNAGTYRKVTVNAQGHVTAGVDGVVPITEGGTGASNAEQALRNLGVATQAEAEAGTSNDKVMTPLRTKQAIEAFDNTPVGDIVFRPYLKRGYVKANGATVNRADYPRLVAFANANNLWTTNPANEPWKFGQGNGSTTMVLPNYVGRFIQGGDTPTIKEAGLPNITGEFSTECGNWPWHDHPNSAIYQNGLISNNGGFAGSDTDDLVKFDASRSNSIYGNSSTVQPPAITLLPQVRY